MVLVNCKVCYCKIFRDVDIVANIVDGVAMVDINFDIVFRTVFTHFFFFFFEIFRNVEIVVNTVNVNVNIVNINYNIVLTPFLHVFPIFEKFL